MAGKANAVIVARNGGTINRVFNQKRFGRGRVVFMAGGAGLVNVNSAVPREFIGARQIYRRARRFSQLNRGIVMAA